MIRTPYQNQTKCYLSGRVSSMFEEVMLHALEKNTNCRMECYPRYTTHINWDQR